MSQPLEEVNFHLSPDNDTSAVDTREELDVLLGNFHSADVKAVPSTQNSLIKVDNEQTTVPVVNSGNKVREIANENKVKIENDLSTSRTNSETDGHSMNVNIEGLEKEIKYEEDFEYQCYECKLCGHIAESNCFLEYHLKIKHDVHVKLAQYEFEDVEIDIKHHNLSYECLEIVKNEDVKQVIANNQSDNEPKTSTLNDVCKELKRAEREKNDENKCTEAASLNENVKLYQCSYCTFCTTLRAELRIHTKSAHRDKIENNLSTSRTNSETDGHNMNVNVEGLEEEIKYEEDFEDQCYECKLCGHIAENNGSLEYHLKIKHDVHVKLVQYKFEDIEIDIKRHNLSLECSEIGKNEDVRQVIANNQSDNEQKTSTLNDACKELRRAEREKDNENINESVSEHNENVKFYQCSYCTFRTTLRAELRIHTKSVHKDRQYHCQFCDFKTKPKRYLQTHTRRQHSAREKYDGETKWYSCEFCFHTTKNKYSSIYHFKKKHMINKQLCCRYCDYKTEDKSSLKTHFRREHDEYAILYRCCLCTFRTKSKYHYSQHLKEKHPDIKYKCEFCEFTTSRKPSLQVHFKVKHDKDAEWFTCTLCDYKTKLKQKLAVHHYASHTTTRRYRCNICKLRTKFRADMKRHYTVKHDENAQWYNCDLCTYKTKARLYMIRHFSLQHRCNGNAMRHQCQFCEQKMKSKTALNRHIKFKHQESIG